MNIGEFLKKQKEGSTISLTRKWQRKKWGKIKKGEYTVTMNIILKLENGLLYFKGFNGSNNDEGINRGCGCPDCNKESVVYFSTWEEFNYYHFVEVKGE